MTRVDPQRVEVDSAPVAFFADVDWTARAVTAL